MATSFLGLASAPGHSPQQEALPTKGIQARLGQGLFAIVLEWVVLRAGGLALEVQPREVSTSHRVT